MKANQHGIHPIYGRDLEFKTIFKCFHEAKGQNGRVVVLTGPAGIGKSRLLRHVTDAIRQKNSGFVALSQPAERGYTYQSFLSALIDLLKNSSLTSRQIQRTVSINDLAVLTHLDSEFCQFQAFDLSANPSEEAPRQAIINVFRAISRIRPVIIVIDDLEERSMEDQELFFSCTQSLSTDAVMLIGAIDSSVIGKSVIEEMDRIESIGKLINIKLHPLDQNSSRKIIDFSAGHPVNQLISDHIHQVTGGNPLFLIEFVKTYENAGYLRESGTPDRRDVSDILPTTLTNIIYYNFSRRPDDMRQILETAAIIGRQFDSQFLQEFLGIDSKKMLSLLNELRPLDFLTPIGINRWQFQAGLIRKIILERMNPELKLDIQCNLIEKLSDYTDPDKKRLRLFLLGDLAERCPGKRIAIDEIYQAGREAEKVFERKLALRLYSVASHCLDNDEDSGKETMLRVRFCELKLKRFMNSSDRLIQAWKILIPQLIQYELKEESIGACLELALIHLKLNNLEQTKSTLDNMDEMILKHEHGEYRSRMMLESDILRLTLSYRSGEKKNFEKYYRKLDPVMASRVSPEYAWRIASFKAGVSLDMEDLDSFWQHSNMAETYAVQAGDPLLRYKSDILRGKAEIQAGRFKEGEIRIRAAIRYFWESGFNRFYADCMVQLGTNLIYQGRQKEAVEALNRIIITDIPEQMPVTYILSRAMIARAYNDIGEFTNALTDINRGLALKLPAAFPYGEGLLWLEKSRALSETGTPNEVMYAAEKAESLLREFEGEEYNSVRIILCRLAWSSKTAVIERSQLDWVEEFCKRSKSVAAKLRLMILASEVYAIRIRNGDPSDVLKLQKMLYLLRDLVSDAHIPQMILFIEAYLTKTGVIDVLLDFCRQWKASCQEIDPILEISICGRFEIRLSSRLDPIARKDWGSDKARQLLIALLLDGSRSLGMTRESLGQMIWPELPEQNLINAFHIALSNLRKALGPAGKAIEYFEGRYRLNPNLVHVDYWIIENELKKAEKFDRFHQPHLARESREIAISFYKGDLLSDRYENWIDPYRENLKTKIRGAMNRSIRQDIKIGNHQEIIRNAQNMLKIDVADEEAHRYLIEAVYALGDRSGAIRQYQRLVKILHEELDVRPDIKTELLISSIKKSIKKVQ